MQGRWTIFLTNLTIFGFFIFGQILMNSCEKDSAKKQIDGTWEFYKNCNKNLYRACIFNVNRNFNEIIKIDGNSFLRFYDDSIVLSEDITIIDTLIVYSKGIFAQEYIMRNDTLTLIDTCFACDYNVYIKRK